MKAWLIEHIKAPDEAGNTIEIKIWQLPAATEDKPHGYKYSYVYIVGKRRVIGYDNAEGRGDHRHVKGKVEPYSFVSIRKLTEDFYGDIEKYKRGEL
jgi:hypothetical protein